MPHRNQSPIPEVKDLEPRLDITRPFMDDIGEAFPITRTKSTGSHSRFAASTPGYR